jgi:hypothetical protein
MINLMQIFILIICRNFICLAHYSSGRVCVDSDGDEICRDPVSGLEFEYQQLQSPAVSQPPPATAEETTAIKNSFGAPVSAAAADSESGSAASISACCAPASIRSGIITAFV